MFLSFIKETNIFLYSEKEGLHEQSRLIRTLASHIMYIGFEYVMLSPRKYF